MEPVLGLPPEEIGSLDTRCLETTITLTETCSCPPEAGNDSCELRNNISDSSCPVCLKTGKRVDSLTLKALLNVPLTDVRRVQYRFCSTPDCPVVYYSQDGAQSFLEIRLQERVYQKHLAADDVLVCYCFRYTTESIKAEFADNRAGTIVAMINAGIQAGQCACDIRNPQGSCCLGNVRAIVRNLEAHPS